MSFCLCFIIFLLIGFASGSHYVLVRLSFFCDVLCINPSMSVHCTLPGYSTSLPEIIMLFVSTLNVGSAMLSLLALVG